MNGTASPEAEATGSTLEQDLGDPYDPTNPAGYSAVLAADDAGEMAAPGVALLRRRGIGAEFVPRSLGGRFTGPDDLVRQLRPVFRRDAGLGLGHGLTSLMAALPIWSAGSVSQQERVAGLLQEGRPVAVAFHELSHGNDLASNALNARSSDGGWLLSGEKHVINNADVAQAALVLARTGSADRVEHGHTLLLVDGLDSLPPEQFTRLPRFATSGLPGCRLSGLRFDECAVPEPASVGQPGTGVPVALAAFQVSRCVTAGAVTSLLESSLDAVLRFARGRRLYGRTVLELPHARSLVSGALADLHLAQAMASMAARALHLHPEGGARYAAATKYLVPLVVESALSDLAVVLGARSFLREGEYAIVGKHLRDAGGVSIGHGGGFSCALTVLGQLAGLRPSPEPAAAELFGATPLADLDLARLRLVGRRTDPLLTTAVELATSEAASPAHDDTTCARLRSIAAAASSIGADAAALPHAARGVGAEPRAIAVADRYARVLAAAACLGHYALAAPGDLAGSPAWLASVVRRLCTRGGRPVHPGPAAEESELVDRATALADGGMSLDLVPDPVIRSTFCEERA